MALRKTIYSEEYRYVVSRLREAREKAHFTQKQVAQFLGITQSFVSKIESGQYRVDVVQLSQFAKLYKKNLKFFIK
ncbi:MAG: helix-turn-helix domain-containing protein [Sedimentisphaerales bacterium]